MTKDLQLGIPSPCSEDWDQMTPEARGRFCSSCQKTVLDFTAMEDKEILQWLANYRGSACGRFRTDQLDRPLVAPRENKTRWRYWHYLIAGLLFSSKVSAQEKPAAPPATEQCSPDEVMGKTSMHQPTPSANPIRCRVVNQDRVPIVGATIIFDKTQTTFTDLQGYFSIPGNKIPLQGAVSIVSMGYTSVHIDVNELRKIGQIQLLPVDASSQHTAGIVAVRQVRSKPGK